MIKRLIIDDLKEYTKDVKSLLLQKGVKLDDILHLEYIILLYIEDQKITSMLRYKINDEGVFVDLVSGDKVRDLIGWIFYNVINDTFVFDDEANSQLYEELGFDKKDNLYIKHEGGFSKYDWLDSPY